MREEFAIERTQRMAGAAQSGYPLVMAANSSRPETSTGSFTSAKATSGLPLAGIALLVGGLSAAALSGALMKLLSESMPVVQIVWLRFTGYFLLMIPLVAIMSRRAVWPIPRPGLQAIRGLTMIGATILFVAGARTLSFADAVAILYAYPFLLTLAAPFFLDERVSPAGWLGVVGGFVGVLIVVRPSFEGIGLDAVMVFGCAVLVAAQLAINRKLGTVADPLVTSCYGAGVAMLVTALVIPWIWVPVAFEHIWLLVALAITGAISQTTIVMAFMRTPASDLAPFTYSEIVSAIVFGILIFDTWPDMWSWIGIALVIASGIGVAHAMALRATPQRIPKV